MSKIDEHEEIMSADPYDRLATQSAVVTRFGRLMMSAGAGAYRTKASMARVAAAVGIERLHVEISMTDLVTTSHANGEFRTNVIEQRAVGVNADRLDMLNNLVASLQPDTLAEDVDKELDLIEGTHHLYGTFVNAAASGVACAGFSFLNAGGPVECLAVLVAAFFGQMLRRQMLLRHMNHFGVWMVCGFAAASIYIAMVALLTNVGLATGSHQAGFISSILFLVPGFPMVTGILDLVRGDYLAGISRSTYVATVMVSAGVAVWIVSYLFEWRVQQDYKVTLTVGLLWLFRALASFVAAYGFAMLFNTPQRICAVSGAIAIVTNCGRLALTDNGVPGPLAVGIASVAIGLIVALLVPWVRCSRVSLSVPASVIMIPGVPFYRSLSTINPVNNADMYSWYAGALPLVQVLATILAIGIGLAIARMLTDYNWAHDQFGHATPDLKDTAHNPVR